MSLSQQSLSVLKTSLAGSLRHGCFSTQPRRRQYCSGLRSSEIRCRLRAALTSQERWSGGPVSRLRQAARCHTWLSPDYGPTRHGSHTQLQLSHTRTAPHPTATDTRRRQDDRPQHLIISAGLRQRTAARDVGLQHQQAAGGATFVNSLVRTVCQASRSASATELRRQLHWLLVRQRISYKVAVITYKTRSTSKPAYLSPPPAGLPTSLNITIIGQTVTVCTSNGVSVLGESLQRQRPFSLELAVVSSDLLLVVSASICWTV